MDKKHKTWGIILVLAAVATVIDIIIPDPLPFIDEILLITLTLFATYKEFSIGRN